MFGRSFFCRSLGFRDLRSLELLTLITSPGRSICSTVFFSSTSLPSDPRPRTPAFYEENARLRRYFYHINSRGLLFLEDIERRNYASSIKDAWFVDFTMKNLQLNETGIYKELPFVSFCGREINFVAVDDAHAAVVFVDLIKSQPGEQIISRSSSSSRVVLEDRDLDDALEKGHQGKFWLRYGYELKHPFDPSKLLYAPDNGRVYHRVWNHKFLTNQVGLLHPHLAEKLSEYFVLHDNEKEQEHIKVALISKHGKNYPLETI